MKTRKRFTMHCLRIKAAIILNVKELLQTLSQSICAYHNITFYNSIAIKLLFSSFKTTNRCG